MMSTIAKKLKSPSCDTPFRVCVYGKSGTGKTTFSGTFPKPLLHIVCSSIGTNESLPLVGVKGIYDLELEKADELLEVCTIADKFKTIVVDHVTGLQDLVLKEIVGTDDVALQKNWGMISRDQYSVMSLRIKRYLHAIMSTKKNVVLICQEREVSVDEVDGITPYVSSALTPSLCSWVHAACDFILHTFIRQRTEPQEITRQGEKIILNRPIDQYEFCAHLGPNSVYVTKCRSTREVPSVLVNPSFRQLAQLVKGGKDEDEKVDAE